MCKPCLFFLFFVCIACGFDRTAPSGYEFKSIGELVDTNVHLLEYNPEKDSYLLKACESFQVVTVADECNHTKILNRWSSEEFEDLLNRIFLRGYQNFPVSLKESFEKGGELFVSGEFEASKKKHAQLLEKKKILEKFLAFYGERSNVEQTLRDLADVEKELKMLESIILPAQDSIQVLFEIKKNFMDKLQTEKVFYKKDFSQSSLSETQYLLFKRIISSEKDRVIKLRNLNGGTYSLMSDNRANLYLLRVTTGREWSTYTYTVAVLQITEDDLNESSLDVSNMVTLVRRSSDNELYGEIDIAPAEGGGIRLSYGSQVKFWRTTAQSQGQQVFDIKEDTTLPSFKFDLSSGRLILSSQNNSAEDYILMGDKVFHLEVSRYQSKLTVSDVLMVDANTIQDIPFRHTNELLSTKFLSTLEDDDGDGVGNSKDQCLNSRSDEFVALSGSRMGCNNDDDDNDGIFNDQDACKGTPSGSRVWKEGKFIGCAEGQKRDVDVN